MTDALRWDVADRIATITLARPEARNPLSPDVVTGLIGMLRSADADAQIKCILIQAEGKDFSAGGDVKSFAATLDGSAAERFDAFERRVILGNRLPQALLETRKPIVAAPRGAVAGAGMALCLAADIVVAGESSYFVAAHVLLGLSLDCGLSALLPPAMGIKQAKRIALLGERVDAQEALALGIVTRVVPDDRLADEVAKVTRRLAAGPATAMAGTKSLLNQAAHRGVVEQLAAEARQLGACAATDDFRRGVEAVLGRQRPTFD